MAAVDDGRFTAAAALGLKIRVLLLAASPLFNANEPYLAANQPTGGNAGKISAADIDKMVWYGNYDRKRWERVVECISFGGSGNSGCGRIQEGFFWLLRRPL